MRRLGRRPDRQAGRCAGIVARQHGAAFERHGAAAMQRTALPRTRAPRVRMPRRRRRSPCGTTAAMLLARSLCARAAPGFSGVAAVAHRGQDLEVDGHRGGGILREVAVVRDHHRDGLADIADLVARQRELRARRPDRRIGHQHRDLAGRHARRQIVGGEHRVHAGHRERRDGVDRADPGMGVRAAHEAGVQRAGKLDVVDEAAAPGEQRRIFEARDAGAEMFRAHGRCPGTAQGGDATIHRQRCIAIATSRPLAAHLSIAGVLWLWSPEYGFSRIRRERPEIVSRARFVDMLDVSAEARRSARPAGRPAARFPGASRRARGAGTARARRPPDQQGHRAASAGALAVPGRARGRTSAARSCSRTSSTRPAAATTFRSRSARSRLRRKSMPSAWAAPVEEIEAAWMHAIAHPIPPVAVSSPPCQEVVITGDELRGAGQRAGARCRCRSRRRASTPRPISPRRFASRAIPTPASRTWAPIAAR